MLQTILNLRVSFLDDSFSQEYNLHVNHLLEAFIVTKETFGRLDILVNNAEIRNDKFWELQVDVNLVC